MGDEIEEMTALSLGNGGSKHSKSWKGVGCKLKSPVQFDALFPDQEDTELDGGQTKKKLKRLSVEQVTMLEGVYEKHHVPDPDLKQGLAKTLNIRPRQVQVWFQNKRARTKQKQTAEDYENLKRWSEGLFRENQKLKKELQELMSISQHYKTSDLVAVCWSCNKVFRDHGHEQKL